MSNRDEIERQKRIRERQLKLRDPNAKDKNLMRQVSTNYRTKRKSLTVGSVLADIPGKWWGAIFGVVAGSILAVMLNVALAAEWVAYVGYIVVLAFAVIGWVVGTAVDWREEDHSKLTGRR